MVSCAKLYATTEARRLEVRCGIKKQGDTRKNYVHMLNGTLCATERALCCLVENYQTIDVRPVIESCALADEMQGLVIPEALRPYMQGRDFIPFTKELPKGLQKKKA